MKVRLHSHALDRLKERGATMAEVVYTVQHGRQTPAKFGRARFTHVFAYNRKWLGQSYASKEVQAFAEREAADNWLVLTVIVRFF